MSSSSIMRVLIVDDEELGRDCVRLALHGVPDVQVIGECATGAGAVEAIVTDAPDLVLLDVQMPEMDGFEVIERVGRARMPLVVFITAHDEHALHAFDVHALDYVLKPFDDERVREAVERARWLIETRRGERADADAGALTERLTTPQRDSDVPRAKAITRITVKRDGRAYFVPVREIDYIEAAGNYVKLHVRGAAHPLRATVRSLVTQLDPLRFTRIHKSTIVNVERVREVQPWFGGDYVAILHDGTQLRVSRTYVQELLRPFR